MSDEECEITGEHLGDALDLYCTERRAHRSLRAVVAKAIADLDAEHYQHPHDPSFCGGCGFSLPCPSARVADDLRRAVES